MRTVASVGAVLALVCLAACGDPTAHGAATVASTAASSSTTAASTTAASTTSASTGTLTGVVRLYGGPLNPTTGKMALNGAPGPDWAVAVMSGSRTVAHATSDAAGRFRFVLAPGRYTLECGQNRMVVVTAGRTVSTDCDVPVP